MGEHITNAICSLQSSGLHSSHTVGIIKVTYFFLSVIVHAYVLLQHIANPLISSLHAESKFVQLLRDITAMILFFSRVGKPPPLLL